MGRTEGSGARQAYQNAEVFPIGVPNDRFAKYFIGQSYLAPVSAEQVKIFNVAFEPGCRDNWHIHKADKGVQILILVAVRLLSGVGQSPAGTAPW